MSKKAKITVEDVLKGQGNYVSAFYDDHLIYDKELNDACMGCDSREDFKDKEVIEYLVFVNDEQCTCVYMYSQIQEFDIGPKL